MSAAKKLVPTLIVSGILIVSSFSSANALSIIAPAASVRSESQGALAAYTSAAQDAGSPETSLLSPGEVEHIRWCAERYRSYHATDNTFAAPTGVRAICRSPH
jgi:hypothetical protein